MATNILIVDDETDVLNAWARTLRLAGYTVFKASDANTALQLCREHAFDLVVLDYLMPSMTGIELLNEIRVHLPTVRSIIVSGKIQEKEEEVALELRNSIEADSYLHKPLDNAKLRDMVKQLISQQPAADWVGVAERTLNSRKPKAKIRDIEKALNGQAKKSLNREK